MGGDRPKVDVPRRLWQQVDTAMTLTDVAMARRYHWRRKTTTAATVGKPLINRIKADVPRRLWQQVDTAMTLTDVAMARRYHWRRKTTTAATVGKPLINRIKA